MFNSPKNLVPTVRLPWGLSVVHIEASCANIPMTNFFIIYFKSFCLSDSKNHRCPFQPSSSPLHILTIVINRIILKLYKLKRWSIDVGSICYGESQLNIVAKGVRLTGSIPFVVLPFWKTPNRLLLYFQSLMRDRVCLSRCFYVEILPAGAFCTFTGVVCFSAGFLFINFVIRRCLNEKLYNSRIWRNP